MPSAPGRVYFSQYVPLAYAILDHKSGPGWIFAIEFSDEDIATGCLAPDEDVIGSKIGSAEGWWNPLSGDPAMILRMANLISTIHPTNYASQWHEYLEESGNVSWFGLVSPKKIRRYTRVDVGNIPEVIAIYREFNQRTWPRDPQTGQATGDAKRIVRAVYSSLTDSIMNGAEFNQLDVLYPVGTADRDRRIEKFVRQMKNGFKRSEKGDAGT